MAEIEIGSLVRSCLNKRIESAEKIRTEVAAYLIRKNQNPVPIKWQFTNEDARIKLHQSMLSFKNYAALVSFFDNGLVVIL